jgi:hypothetical protein
MSKNWKWAPGALRARERWGGGGGRGPEPPLSPGCLCHCSICCWDPARDKRAIRLRRLRMTTSSTSRLRTTTSSTAGSSLRSSTCTDFVRPHRLRSLYNEWYRKVGWRRHPTFTGYLLKLIFMFSSYIIMNIFMFNCCLNINTCTWIVSLTQYWNVYLIMQLKYTKILPIF